LFSPLVFLVSKTIIQEKMRKLIRFLVYALVIFGAYKFFTWIRSDRDHHEHSEHVEVHVHDNTNSARLDASDMRNLDAFDALSIHGVYEVDLRQGNESSIRIEANDKLLEQIVTQVNNDRLTVTTRKKKWKPKDEVRLIITSPAIREISIGGGVDLDSEGPIQGDYLKVSVSGAADLDLEIEVDELDVNLSGAANAEMKGHAANAKFSVSGAGHIEANGLEASAVRVSLSGAGALSVHATESLDVGISGAGSVTYRGNPALTKRVSGLGIVRQESPK
jgi:hypothetical protein